MKEHIKLRKLLIDSLSHSLSIRNMVKITRRVIPGYDLYQRSGFPENIPIPSIDAANQIVRDIINEDRVIKFVESLVEVYNDGLMGRKLNIRFLPQILNKLESLGYRYRSAEGIFVENEVGRRTTGWGVLHNGKVYEFAFLNLDIVRNTELVRRYSKELVSQTYNDLRKIVRRLVEKRNGRIWEWQGDGVLAAFYFDDKNIAVSLTGIEILLELFYYNLFFCKLEDPIRVRIAAHTGPCQFMDGKTSVQSDTLRKLELIESRYTLPDSVTISPGIYYDLGTKLETFFEPINIGGENYVYRYMVRWEK